MSQKVLVAIYDYPRGDLADLEVRLALRTYLPGWSIESSSAPSFRTLSTGFKVAQAAFSPLVAELKPENFLIYANCAPRKDSSKARKNNEGEGLVCVTLDNGVKAVVVNSGYSLSFVKKRITSFKTVNVSRSGSQFRSRDLFPELVGAISRGEPWAVGDELDANLFIRDLPTNRVAMIDSFGNMKLTLRKSDRAFQQYGIGDKVRVKIGTTPRTAIVSDGSFNVEEGELALTPGSSGYDDPFIELFLRGGSAQDFFGAEPEDKVLITAK